MGFLYKPLVGSTYLIVQIASLTVIIELYITLSLLLAKVTFVVISLMVFRHRIFQNDVRWGRNSAQSCKGYITILTFQDS